MTPRLVLPEELDTLLRIERACFADEAWSRGMLEEELRRPGGLFFAVGAAGQPVGFAIGWNILEELHVLQVAVDPDARRRGLGRILVSELEAKATGARASWLEVRRDNTAAVALYTGLGYEGISVRPRYYEDGCDALVLRKRLGPG